MKKFKFNLENVLKYRKNVESYEKTVLSGYNGHLLKLLDELEALNRDYERISEEFEELSSRGITVHQIRSSHAMMENLEYSIERKIKEIETQQKLINRQTNVVMNAIKDAKILDKLKETKLEKYKKSEDKSNEAFIEEFVSYQSLTNDKK
ncbi:MAG: flagellar FliJ family protein [Oscillospiraceae bacterium]|nr:flagellar FliJ family protein [Oscillospiraceae bacterium]